MTSTVSHARGFVENKFPKHVYNASVRASPSPRSYKIYPRGEVGVAVKFSIQGRRSATATDSKALRVDVEPTSLHNLHRHSQEIYVS